MGISQINDALQRATAEGEWIHWKSDYSEDGRPFYDVAYLGNSHASVRVGKLTEGLDTLLAKLPEAEKKLRGM